MNIRNQIINQIITNVHVELVCFHSCNKAKAKANHSQKIYLDLVRGYTPWNVGIMRTVLDFI